MNSPYTLAAFMPASPQTGRFVPGSLEMLVNVIIFDPLPLLNWSKAV
jgi:hypothetical protein